MKPSYFATASTPNLDAFIREALFNALKIALREATTKEPETASTVAAPAYDWPRPWFLPSSDAYGSDKDHVSA